MYQKLLPAIMVLLITTGCTLMKTTLPWTKIPISEEIATIHKSPIGLVWREDGIYALFDDNKLYRWHEQTWQARTLPSREGCRRTDYGSLFTLPGGELAMLQVCIATPIVYNILVYDRATDSGHFLLPFDMPKAGSLATDPTQTTLIYQTIRAFGTMYRVTSDALEPLPVTLTQGNKSWYLPDTTEVEAQWNADPARVDRRVYEAGILANVTWSPDGNWIAVGATLEPQGKPLATQGYYDWNIYLINPDTLESKILVSGIEDSGLIFGWSPDSRWLLYKEGGGKGLWIVNIESGTRHNVFKGQIDSSTWNPDGTQILTTSCSIPICNEYELVIIDVSSLTQR
jgi:WD40 repeat protein